MSELLQLIFETPVGLLIIGVFVYIAISIAEGTLNPKRWGDTTA